jgi:quercetin dioxygenase-like cupin family protein
VKLAVDPCPSLAIGRWQWHESLFQSLFQILQGQQKSTVDGPRFALV